MFLNCNISQAQSCNFSGNQIPRNQKIYMIGEVHIDNVRQKKTQDEIFFMNRMLACEDTIRTFLTDSCSVNHFVLESPVSLEYFFNKYVQTGDTSWIDLFSNNEYQQGKVRDIRKQFLNHPDITITCIDFDYRSIYWGFLQSLFCITFYEPYMETFEVDAKLKSLYQVYDNPELATQLLKNNIDVPLQVKDCFSRIIKWYKNHPPSITDSMVYYFKNVFDDDLLLNQLAEYYGNDSIYFYRLISSFLIGSIMATDTKNDLYVREQRMFENIAWMISLAPYDIYCFQMGANHVLPNTDFDVIRQKIQKELPDEPYCFYSIPLSRISYFTNDLPLLPESIKTSSCYIPYSARESCFVVK